MEKRGVLLRTGNRALQTALEEALARTKSFFPVTEPESASLAIVDSITTLAQLVPEGFKGAVLGLGISGADIAVSLSMPVRLGAVLEALEMLAGTGRWQVGSWVFDSALRLLMQDDATLPLTEKESVLLACLCFAGGQAVSREALLSEVWGYQEGLDTHTLETHIYRLRQKLEVNPEQPEILLTAEGGYAVKV